MHNQTALLAAIPSLTFEGASGDVVFDSNLDRVGDFEIVQMVSHEIVPVGTWTGGDRAISVTQKSMDLVNQQAKSCKGTGTLVIALTAVAAVSRRILCHGSQFLMRSGRGPQNRGSP